MASMRIGTTRLSGSSTSSSARSLARALRRAPTGSAIASLRPIHQPITSLLDLDQGYSSPSLREVRAAARAARLGALAVKCLLQNSWRSTNGECSLPTFVGGGWGDAFDPRRKPIEKSEDEAACRLG